MKSIWFFVRFFSIIKIEDRVRKYKGVDKVNWYFHIWLVPSPNCKLWTISHQFTMWDSIRSFSIIKIERRQGRRIQGCWQAQVIFLHLISSLSKLQTLNNISSIYNVRYDTNRTTLEDNKKTRKVRTKIQEHKWSNMKFTKVITIGTPHYTLTPH